MSYPTSTYRLKGKGGLGSTLKPLSSALSIAENSKGGKGVHLMLKRTVTYN